MVRFSPEIVMQVKDIKCEKISSHIHILTFEVLNIKDLQEATLMKSVNIMEDVNNQNTLEL
jgi:hypothetical protein